MSNSPDDIRDDIDRTRGELSRDVDALAEKVDPNKVVDRQTDKIRGKWTNLRESVMGSPDDDHGRSGMEQTRELADEAGQMARNAPEEAKRRTRGNPLAAGLVALGAGWLVGSILPASGPEQEAAAAVKDKSQPLAEEAKSAAQEMGENLKPQAQDAAESLQESARGSAERVTGEGQRRAKDLQDDSQQAAKRVRDASQES